MTMVARPPYGVAAAVTTISVSSTVRPAGLRNCSLGFRNAAGLRTSFKLVRRDSCGRDRYQGDQGSRRQVVQPRAELNDNQKESLQLYGQIERSVS